MSMLGSLAMGVAGGASAFASQAQGDIEKNQKLDIARQTAEIEAQMRMRLAEFTSDLGLRTEAKTVAQQNTPERLSLLQGAARSNAVAAGETARTVDTARLGDEALNAAGQAKAASDAKAANKTLVDLAMSNAGNKDYLKAKWDDLMKDPRINAAYTSAMASAGAAGTQAKLAAEQLTQLKNVGARAEEVRGLQEQLKAAGDDTSRSAIQQRITDLGFVGVDPSKFLSLAEKAQDNARDAVKLLLDPNLSSDPDNKARAQEMLRRANELATKAAAMGRIKMDPAPDAFAIPGAKGGAGGADPYAGKKDGDGKPKDANGKDGKPTAREPARYGLLSGPRVGYLEGLAKAGTINPAEKQELAELTASKSAAWFRGRASEATD